MSLSKDAAPGTQAFVQALGPRTKKFIGLLFLLAWLFVYTLIAMRVGVAVLPNAHWLVTLLYYAIAGTAWIVPFGLLLPWMHREPMDREKTGRRQRGRG